MIDLSAIRAKISADNAEEDRLFEEYCALPNRPTIKSMVRAYENSEPQEMELEDLDDFFRWKQQQINLKGVSDGQVEKLLEVA